MPPRIPDHIARLDPYVPGKPIEELARELGLSEIVKLASNENPYGPSPLAAEAIRAAIGAAGRYPDGAGFHLRHALAARHGLPPESVVLGNGSTELVELLARCFLSPGDEAIVSSGAFVMYRIAVLAANGSCRLTPHTPDLGHDPDAMAEAVGPSTRLIYIANPNNPTGTYLSRAVLERFLDRIPPGVVTVLDEAYHDYVEAPDYPDGISLLGRHPGVVVLRTFSKIHALAGLRIGYALAAPEVAAVLERVRSPFNTSSIAQAAALAALGDGEHVRRSRELNRRERGRLAAGLGALGLHFSPSVANFLLVHMGTAAEAGAVYQRMLRSGVIVRPMAGFGFPGALRVTVGKPEETDRCLEAMRQALLGLKNHSG